MARRRVAGASTAGSSCASRLEATAGSYWQMNDLRKARATTIEVGEEAEAQRIDNFLLRALKGVPKSHVYRVLRSGEVRVNSGRVKPDYRLQPGDRVRIRRYAPPSASRAAETARSAGGVRGRRAPGDRQALRPGGPRRQWRQLRCHRIDARRASAGQISRASAPARPRHVGPPYPLQEAQRPDRASPHAARRRGPQGLLRPRQRRGHRKDAGAA